MSRENKINAILAAMLAQTTAAMTELMTPQFSGSLGAALKTQFGDEMDDRVTAEMERIFPKIIGIMGKVYDLEFVTMVYGGTLEGYTGDEIDQTYDLVMNPMYIKFAMDAARGMMNNPVMMQRLTAIGPEIMQMMEAEMSSIEATIKAEQETLQA